MLLTHNAKTKFVSPLLPHRDCSNHIQQDYMFHPRVRTFYFLAVSNLPLPLTECGYAAIDRQKYVSVR